MKKTILGTIIICIGIILLGNTLEIWDLNIFFKGWWTLFIIIPSLISLVEQENKINAFLSLLIGILLLLATRHIISWHMVGRVFLPIFIIVLGLLIIFGNKKKTKIRSENAKEYLSVFSSVDEEITEVKEDFTATAVFGGIELDLKEATIKEDILISCVSVFGGIKLQLPKDVKVEINGVPIFGGAENKRRGKTGKVKVIIDYVSVFGGIEIE
mgnify:CR=1 FL=1